MPLEPLDYGTPRPRQRVRFLEKCNPKATRKSVVRSAIIYSFIVGGIWLIGALTKPELPHTWPALLLVFMLSGAIAGAVCEWQVDRDEL